MATTNKNLKRNKCRNEPIFFLALRTDLEVKIQILVKRIAELYRFEIAGQVILPIQCFLSSDSQDDFSDKFERNIIILGTDFSSYFYSRIRHRTGLA